MRWALVLGTCAAACHHGGRGPARVPTAVPATTTPTEPAAPASGGPTAGDGSSTVDLPDRPAVAELLDAGAVPRATLRIDVPRGHHEGADLAYTIRSTLNGTNMVLPTVIMGMVTDVTAIDHGNFVTTIAFDRIDVIDPPGGAAVGADVMRNAFNSVRGIVLDATLTPRGEVHDMTAHLPAGTPPSMVDSVRQNLGMGQVLPEEPVGIGARWRVVLDQDTQGVRQHYTMVFTLVARGEHTASLTGDLAFEGSNANVSTRGSGAMTIDFDDRRITQVMHVSMTIGTSGSAAPAANQTSVDMTVTVRP